MLTCPVCHGRATGKIGTDQYFCWNCLIEFDDHKQAYNIDADGNLMQFWQDQITGGENDEETQ